MRAASIHGDSGTGTGTCFSSRVTTALPTA